MMRPSTSVLLNISNEREENFEAKLDHINYSPSHRGWQVGLKQALGMKQLLPLDSETSTFTSVIPYIQNSG